MRLLEILDRDGVAHALEARDRASVLDALARLVAQKAGGRATAEILRARLLDREKDRSTAIGHGVAVPHGRAPEIERLLAVIGRTAEPVNFGAIDGEPVRLFFVLAAPESQPTAHLKALARIAKLLKNESLRTRLLTAPDADAMFAAIREEDGKD